MKSKRQTGKKRKPRKQAGGRQVRKKRKPRKQMRSNQTGKKRKLRKQTGGRGFLGLGNLWTHASTFGYN